MLNVVGHVGNPSSWEPEAGGFQGQGEPGPQSKILSQKKLKKKKIIEGQ
jgi:hypothetical protein